MTDDRTLQLRLTGFRKAEASLRLEGMDPSGTPLYESVKTRILSGDITFDEGRTEIPLVAGHCSPDAGGGPLIRNHAFSHLTKAAAGIGTTYRSMM